VAAVLVVDPVHLRALEEGTYENPRDWVHRCGFDDEKEQCLLAMLAYRDVHREG